MTIKAVGHYHRPGLVEPRPRDSSGYRRYSAQHAIDLVKIKTLAHAGVPLARIKELLAADPDRFAAAIAEIDRNPKERAEELLRTRDGLGHRSPGRDAGRRVVAGLGPTHPDRQAAQRGAVKSVAPPTLRRCIVYDTTTVRVKGVGAASSLYAQIRRSALSGYKTIRPNRPAGL